MSEPGPEIRHTVFIRAPREKVWAAFTKPQGLDGWWGTRGSEIDLRPGGKLTLHWRDWGAERDINADRDCIVLEVVPPTRFVYQWGETADAMTTVEFGLEEREGGTLLRLREHGFAPTAKGRESFGNNSLGWGEVAALMKFLSSTASATRFRSPHRGGVRHVVNQSEEIAARGAFSRRVRSLPERARRAVESRDRPAPAG